MTSHYFLLSLLLSTSHAFTPPSLRHHHCITVSRTKFTPNEIIQKRKVLSSSTRCFSSSNDDVNVDSKTEESLQQRNQQQGFNPFTKHERPQDITTDSFGPLLPIAKAVDDATGGWGLSYADLHPATPKTRCVCFYM